MESMNYRIASRTQRRPAALLADPVRVHPLRLVADDKRELDQMIQVEQRQGWVLVCRSYSLDDGQGGLVPIEEVRSGTNGHASLTDPKQLAWRPSRDLCHDHFFDASRAADAKREGLLVRLVAA